MSYILRHYFVEPLYKRPEISHKIHLTLGRRSLMDSRLSVKSLFLADMLPLHVILISKHHIHCSRYKNIWKILHDLKKFSSLIRLYEYGDRKVD